MSLSGRQPSEFTLRLFGLKDEHEDFYFEVNGTFFVRNVNGEVRRISKGEYNENRLRVVKSGF